MNDHQILYTTIILVIFYSNFNIKCETEQFCSNLCKCDLFNGRNRADCRAKRLINPQLEISTDVEIIDLSYNDITTLDNNCFQNFKYLLNISISHNAIHTIYLDTFHQLRRLQNVDLSYNRLESMDERLFISNHRLETLNLEGNKFMSLPIDGPLLRNAHLRVLNLCNSQINYIHSDVFSGLPQLRQLDLSQNLMITLNVKAFEVPALLQSRLQYINLTGNPWICDETLRQAIDMLQQLHDIKVTLKDCQRKSNESKQQFPQHKVLLHTDADQPMFERMQMMKMSTMSEHDIQTTTTTKMVYATGTIADDSVYMWRKINAPDRDVDDDDIDERYADDYDDTEVNASINYDDFEHEFSLRILSMQKEICNESQSKLCQHCRKCFQKVNHLLQAAAATATATSSDGSHKYSTARSCNEFDLNFIFLLGVAAGITIGIIIIVIALCFKACFDTRRKRHTYKAINRENQGEAVANSPTISRQSSPAHSYSTTLAVASRPSAPIPSPPSASQPPQRSKRIRRVRAPQPVERSVVRYDLNQNASLVPARDNFITRLFGRPARHQYYRTFNENTATLIRRLSRSNLFNNNRLSQHFTSERERVNEPSFTTDTRMDVERPETPPPNYGDIIVVCGNDDDGNEQKK